VRRAVSLAFVGAALTGCGGSAETTRVDGSGARTASMTVADAVSRSQRTLAYVRGYLVVPVDDVSRLCTRIPEHGGCEAPSLELANRQDDLRRLAGPVLEHGCCARGSWSPHPVVLHLWLMPGRRAHVLG
jgi:hypothetical protein